MSFIDDIEDAVRGVYRGGCGIALAAGLTALLLAASPARGADKVMVGGSLTRIALVGAEELGNSGFAIPSDEGSGGGTIHRWEQGLSGGEYERFWIELRALLSQNPLVDTVWWQILLANHASPAITPQDRDAMVAVSSAIRGLCAGCEIVISPMPDFWPSNLCPLTRQNEYEVSVRLAQAAVEVGLADRLGPAVSPITMQNYNGPNDPCHQGELGETEHGRTILGFPW